MGDPRGHCEGNTLVVETTNFTDKTAIGVNGNGDVRNSEQLRLVERFTPMSPHDGRMEGDGERSRHVDAAVDASR